MSWPEDPKHPLNCFVLLVLIMAGAVWLSREHASNFDETEYKMLREFAIFSATVLFGGAAALGRLKK